MITLRAGGYKFPAEVWREKNRIYFSFGYNKALIAEIKSLEDSKWHGFDKENPRKIWSVGETEHNKFQLEYLMGGDPYAPFNSALPLNDSRIPKSRYHLLKGQDLPLLGHQPTMIAHILARRHCILACEMGTSKTLADIIASEIINAEFKAKHGHDMTWWYIAPKSALRAVEREFMIWGLKIKPEMLTYEGMIKRVKNMTDQKAPYKITFDESSKIKRFQAQRTQAAKEITRAQREDWPDGYTVLMTGTPAPKSPEDWYSQAEISQPGFLKEGDIYKFRNRLAVIVQRESPIDRGVYPQLVTWRDDSRKCATCGLMAGDHGSDHQWQESVNEVLMLHKRLQGLVLVIFKKDCLDLPDKTYRLIELKPSPSILRAAATIARTSKTTIEGLIRLRELSDGFQYVEEKTGEPRICPLCEGRLISYKKFEIAGTCPTCKDGLDDIGIMNDAGFLMCPDHKPEYRDEKITCEHCGGVGTVPGMIRITKEIPCPKDDLFKDLLDEYDDIGRLVVYAGFTASIDRCARLAMQMGWTVIQLNDGKERIFDYKGTPIKGNYTSIFQDMKREYPKVVIVAHPKSAGMGATFTASPAIFYYSNDFDGESRTQSEDRIHRTGMDLNLGATIIDCIHLPTDQKVLVNLKEKRKLENMSLGEFTNAIEAVLERTT